ncbi:MAG: hypothetical protein RLZZ81_726 [Pseudomonadota bacterium]|jgi:uroporphyrinogen-III synthase
MKSVLLTRNIEENNETIKEISKYNLDLRYIYCPLIKYKTLDFNINILDNYSNIIITSKYAASILAGHNLKQDIWVVGNKSKQLLGKKVAYAAKNVEDLIKYFPSDLYEQAIYLSSNEITKDLPNKIARHIIYNVEYLNELPLSIIKEFKSNIDFILLYSQNSAKTLVKLLLQNNLLEYTADTSKARSQISGEPAERIIDVPNLEVSKVYLQDSLVVAISLKVANIVRPFIKNVVYCDDQNPNDIIKLLSENAKI